jgi:hypothetical protein
VKPAVVAVVLASIVAASRVASAQSDELPAEAPRPNPPRKPHYLRATIETAGLLGLGAAYYAVDPLSTGTDSDDTTLTKRYTLRSFRFDSNLNTTNLLLHPVAGSVVHVTARSNGISLPIAMIYGVGQSLLWELAIEWKDRPSLNDLIITSIGGFAFGEFLFHAADYFTSAPHGGAAQRAAAWTLGFPRRVHMALDHEKPPEDVEPDALGFSSAYGHGFGARYEIAALSNNLGHHGLLHRTAFDAELIAMPGFLKPGRFSMGFDNGNFSELQLRLGFTENGVEETDLKVRSTFFGYYTQRRARDRPSGYAAMLGVGPALRFQESQWLGRRDQLSAVHFPGAHAEVWMEDRRFWARFGAETYVDFATLYSIAYAEYGSRYPTDLDGTKSVMQRRGYCYSLGHWSRVRTAVGWGPLSIFATAAYGHYGSIQGLDRYEERIVFDPQSFEEVVETEVEAALRAGMFFVTSGVRERARTSSFGGLFVRRWDRDFHVSFGLTF